jgi:hypothetical protein
MTNKLFKFSLITLAVSSMVAYGQKPAKQSESKKVREVALVCDIDDDGKMDSVFVNRYDDKDGDRYEIECKLSLLNHKPIISKEEFHNYGELIYSREGFAFTTGYDAETSGEFKYIYNAEKKNMQLERVRIWTGVDANTLESEYYFEENGKWHEWTTRAKGLNINPVEGKSAIFLDSNVGLFSDI